MKNSKIMEPGALHLSAQANLSPRSGTSRTNSTAKRASQEKIGLSAKRLTVSGAAHQSRSVGAMFQGKEVEVNAFYFANGKSFKSFPRSITVDHKRYTFQDGLQMLVQKGAEAIRFFDMTDGFNNYRLREQNDQWFLISLQPAAR